MKVWYENGYYSNRNNGLMLTTRVESSSTLSKLHSAYSASVPEEAPLVIVSYSANYGLESYWTYESYDMGRNGTAYVNVYNGNLTYIYSDLAMTGERLPLSISHVYNSGKRDIDGTYLGMELSPGFRLNILEQFEPTGFADFPYKYTDGDGTEFLFRTDGSTITHEYDATQVLTENNDGTLTLTDAQDNIKHYNLDGFLYEVEDNNGNVQTINWDNGQITSVEDPAGRTATFDYDNEGYLISITDPAGRTTEFEYYQGNWHYYDTVTITRPDGKQTYFSDSSTSGIYIGGPLNNPGVGISVSTSVSGRVGGIGWNANQDHPTSFSYNGAYQAGMGAGQTKVTTNNGYPYNDIIKSNDYSFDMFGRVTSVTN